MKIIEALKKEFGCLRVSNGERWLIFYDFNDTFIVYEQKRYAKKATVIINTTDEDEAVAALTEE